MNVILHGVWALMSLVVQEASFINLHPLFEVTVLFLLSLLTIKAFQFVKIVTAAFAEQAVDIYISCPHEHHVEEETVVTDGEVIGEKTE